MADDPSQLLSIDGNSLSLAWVEAVARRGQRVALAEDARARMARSHAWVAEKGREEAPIYGVNTGFGSLARMRIRAADRATLSRNLVRSHAAGVGAPVATDATRAMVLLRANALAKGVSGCRPLLVDTLLAMLNAGLTPVVPQQGSCGSSGDLAPLAHLGLVLIGDPEGEAILNGVRMSAPLAMAQAGITPLILEAKDGLAITNGAQLTTAISALAMADAQRLVLSAEVAAAMSIEALRGATRAFHADVHALRPYPGARATAANLRALIAGSSLTNSVPDKVQDAYSLRCSPSVIGAARDALAFAVGQVCIELNAATDNPLILLDAELPPGVFDGDPQNRAFSAGLFHGEPVGIAMDVARIAISEVASLSERRLYRLTTGHLSQRLPPALARKDRPELGFLLPQTTAAALVSENKLLCHPSSVDSIPTCEDQEDHVAMSTTAARRTAEVLTNASRVVAIELLGAARALAFRREEDPTTRLGEGTRVALATVEAALADLVGRIPSESIGRLEGLVRDGGLLEGLPPLYGVGEAP